jgi:hypothetical protein
VDVIGGAGAVGNSEGDLRFGNGNEFESADLKKTADPSDRRTI